MIDKDMEIMREKAICMLYCKEYSEKNATRPLKIIDGKNKLEICYQTSSLKPALVLFFRILTEPHIYKRYKSNKHE